MSEPTANGLEYPGVLDAFVYDQKADQVVLAMFERRPWTEENWQTFQLQEKLNAYASFLLDGEYEADFPQLVGKPIVIQLRTVNRPSDRALEFVDRASKQLALQDIRFEVVYIGEDDLPQPASHSCGCGGGGCQNQ